MAVRISKIMGFTLVELMVVIAILAILSTVGITVYSGTQKSARDAKRKSDIDAIAKVWEQTYNIGTGKYADIANVNFASGKVPLDPTGNGYLFSPGSDGKSFIICAALESAPSGTTSCDSSLNYCYCRSSTNTGSSTATSASSSLLANQSGVVNLLTPTPTFTPTPTPTITPTPTNTPTPTPTPTPRPFKYVFISSAVYDGNLGGLSGADAKCQNLASGAGLPGTYKAWLSDGNYSPNMTFTQSTVPYLTVPIYGIGQRTIANNWTDLTDGSLLQNIFYDERGNYLPGSYVWTNTGYLGNRATFYICNQWISNNSSYISKIGGADNLDSRWTQYGSGYCNNTYHLYCFEQ